MNILRAFQWPLIVLFYFFPSILAILKKKKTAGAIVIINAFFGITVLGWILALGLVFRPDVIAKGRAAFKRNSPTKKRRRT